MRGGAGVRGGPGMMGAVTAQARISFTGVDLLPQTKLSPDNGVLTQGKPKISNLGVNQTGSTQHVDRRGDERGTREGV